MAFERTANPGNPRAGHEDHFSNVGAGITDAELAERFPTPIVAPTKEKVNDTSETEPKQAEVGNIVTIILGKNEKRILLTDGSYTYTPPEGQEKRFEEARVDSIMPVNPPVKPGKVDAKRRLSLGEMLNGSTEGAEITLGTGATVRVLKIEKLY